MVCCDCSYSPPPSPRRQASTLQERVSTLEARVSALQRRESSLEANIETHEKVWLLLDSAMYSSDVVAANKLLQEYYVCRHGVEQIRVPATAKKIVRELIERSVWQQAALTAYQEKPQEIQGSLQSIVQINTQVRTSLAQLGLFDLLFKHLSNSQLAPGALELVSTLLTTSTTHPYLTASHIDCLRSHMNAFKDSQIISTIIDQLPPTYDLNAITLLQHITTHSSEIVRLLASKRITNELAKTGAIDTLLALLSSKEQSPSNKWVVKVLTHFAGCSDSRSNFTAKHVCLLFQHIMRADRDSDGVVNLLELLPTELCDAVLTAELQEQFSGPILNGQHLTQLKHALFPSRVRVVFAKAGLESVLYSNLTNATLTQPLLDLIGMLINDSSACQHLSTLLMTPLLQHLMTTNREMLTDLVYVLQKNNSKSDDVLYTKGVIEVLLSVLNAKAIELLRKLNKSVVCAAIVKLMIATDKLPQDLQNNMLNYFRLSPISRDEQAPWYIAPDVLQPLLDGRKYVTLPGQKSDLELVAKLYQKSPVPGYDVKSVTIVHSEHLFNSFMARVEALQERKDKPAFIPHWRTDNSVFQDERAHREKVMAKFESLVEYKYISAPDVHLVLGWHGTRKETLASLFSTGFANLAFTDAGFFGKGLYTTPDAEYAYHVYNSGALLVNWVAVFSPYPVIAADEAELAEKGNFRNYDAHFVPVYSPNHPRGVQYHACEADQVAQYSELVVFDSAQMLARYIVELQPTMPREIEDVNYAFSTTKMEAIKPPKTGMEAWNVDQVCSWVATLQLSKDYSLLLRENSITGEVLPTMTQQDWKDLGMKNFGDSRLLALKVSRYENYA